MNRTLQIETPQHVVRHRKAAHGMVHSSSKLGLVQRSASFGRNLTRSFSNRSVRSLKNFRSNSWSNRSSSNGLSQQEQPQSQSKNERKPYLLEQLGGMAALNSMVLEFSKRISEEESLEEFFRDVNPRLVHAHHERFFAIAFTDVNLPQAALVIQKTHKDLFARGLCEQHFDTFVRHFAETLKDRGFGDAIVKKIMSVVVPLRDIFGAAAQDCNSERENDESVVGPSEEDPANTGIDAN